MDLVNWQDVARTFCGSSVSDPSFHAALVALFQHQAPVPDWLETDRFTELMELWIITRANVWGQSALPTRWLDLLSTKVRSPLFESLAIEYLCNLRLSSGSGAFHEGLESVRMLSNKFPQSERCRLRLMGEEAIVLLNRGRSLQSIEILEQMLSQSSVLDLSGLQATLASLVINLINRGMLQKAERVYGQLKQTAQTLDSDALRARLAYVNILLKDACAMQISRKALQDLVWEGTKYQLLSVQAMIRSELRSGHLLQAEKMIRELSDGMTKVTLNPDVLHFAETLLEIALTRRSVGAAELELAGTAIADALARGDLRAEARTRMMRGALLSLKGQYGKASQDLRQASRICEEQGLYFDLQEVLLHRAGLAYLQGQKGLAIGLLSQTLEGYRQAGMRVLELAVTYLYETLDRDTVQASLLFRVLESRHGQQIAHVLGLYPFLSRIRLSLVARAGASMCTEGDLRRLVTSGHSIFLFVEQGLALFRSGRRGFVLVRMPSLSGFENAVLALLRSETPLSIVDLHNARSNFPFDPDRHGPSLRSWIVRFRQDAEDAGIELLYTSQERGYVLRCQQPVLAISPAPSGRIRKGQLHRSAEPDQLPQRQYSAREEFILRFARERDRITVKDLCQHLSVTRQALNPVLRKLVHEGELKIVKRGRSSYYRKK